MLSIDSAAPPTAVHGRKSLALGPGVGPSADGWVSVLGPLTLDIGGSERQSSLANCGGVQYSSSSELSASSSSCILFSSLDSEKG